MKLLLWTPMYLRQEERLTPFTTSFVFAYTRWYSSFGFTHKVFGVVSYLVLVGMKHHGSPASFIQDPASLTIVAAVH